MSLKEKNQENCYKTAPWIWLFLLLLCKLCWGAANRTTTYFWLDLHFETNNFLVFGVPFGSFSRNNLLYSEVSRRENETQVSISSTGFIQRKITQIAEPSRVGFLRGIIISATRCDGHHVPAAILFFSNLRELHGFQLLGARFGSDLLIIFHLTLLKSFNQARRSVTCAFRNLGSKTIQTLVTQRD